MIDRHGRLHEVLLTNGTPKNLEDGEAFGPCCWIVPKGAEALDIEDGAKPVHTLDYMYRAVHREFAPEEFVMVFAGHEIWKLTVLGRNLRYCFNRINDRCVRRFRRADRDFGQDDGKPVITDIKVEDITPRDKG